MTVRRRSRFSVLLAVVAMLAAVLPLTATNAGAAPLAATNLVISAGKTDVGDYNLASHKPTRAILTQQWGLTGANWREPVDVVTPGYLSDVDIFFDGWVFDTDADPEDVSGRSQWTTAELTALNNWVNAGGVLITNEDSSNADQLITWVGGTSSAGQCQEDTEGDCSDYTVRGAATDIVTGVGGTWATLDTRGTIGHFGTLGAPWTVVGEDASGNATIAYRTVGSGFVILTGDEGIWSMENDGDFTTGPTDNEIFAYNAFDFARQQTDDTWVRVVGVDPQESPQGAPIPGVSFSVKNGTASGWSATGLPAGLGISGAGAVSGTPTTIGSNTVTVTADMGADPDVTFTFDWEIVANTPAAAADDDFTGVVDTFVEFDICANDSGNGPLSVQEVLDPFGLDVLPAGLNHPTGGDSCIIAGVVTETFSDDIDYTLEDVDGDTSTATITLNIVPEIAATGDTIVGVVGQALVGANICTNDAAHSGVTLTFEDALPAGLVAGESGAPAVGCLIVGTPTAPFGGSVTYRIADSNNATGVTAEIAFSISAAPAPVATDDTVQVASGGSVSANVCSNDGLVPGVTNTVTSSNAPAWLTQTGDGNCIFTGTPPADGSYTADYTLTAGGQSDTARLTINVGAGVAPDPDNRTLECAPAGGFSLAGSTPGKQTNGDSFGESIASGDFNGDGLADVAIGAPDDNDGKGSVTVFLSPCGSSNARRYTQSGAVPGNNKGKDHFGHSLAAGDFDGDGRDDLAIGVPWEDVNGVKNSGAVTVLYGSTSGISKSDNQYFTQVGPTPGANERLDRFGFSLGAGDFDGDGRDDLLVGVPYERIGSKKTKAGAVVMLLGSNNGLTNTGSKLFTQKGKVSEKPAKGDRFGFAIATGDFNNDGNDDAAIGAPYEDHGGTNNVGAVHILDGSSSGLGTSGQQLFRGNSTGQRLGWRLAAGNLTGDAFDDLLAGERATGSRGGVNMFAGSATGISLADSTSQADSSSASPNKGDRYSMGLAVVDIDGDGVGEAAVGAPREDSAGSNAGAVHVYEITGGRFGAETYYTQANSAVPGSPATGANFGQVLAAGSDGSLFVGAPGGTAGSTANAGMVAPI